MVVFGAFKKNLCWIIRLSSEEVSGDQSLKGSFHLCVDLRTDLLISQRHELVGRCEDTLHQASLPFQLVVLRRGQSQIRKTTECCRNKLHYRLMLEISEKIGRAHV